MGRYDFQVDGAESVSENAVRVAEKLQALRFESGDRLPWHAMQIWSCKAASNIS